MHVTTARSDFCLPTLGGVAPRPLVRHLGLALASVFAVQGAVAQSAAPAEPQQLERVFVTGSNIRRISSETSSPVQVLKSDDLKASGFTSVADVLSSLTANGQGTLSNAFAGAFATGATGVSLRGLTVGATLVLIDGKRMAPYPLGDDGQRSFVDTSSIPFDAIERVEVLKDGASAVYGSDAIAGVVNIVLKRSYVGNSVTAEFARTSKGDGNTRRVSGIIGRGDMAQDGHNAYLSLEYRQQDPIYFSQRPGVLTRTDYTPLGGINLTPGVPNINNGGQPASRTGYITDPTGAVSDIAGFLKGCDATKLAAGQCAYQNTWSQIQPTTRNLNLAARFTQKLAEDWQLSLSASRFESKAEQLTAPSASYSGGYQGLKFGPGMAPSLLPGQDATTITNKHPAFPADASGLTSGTLNYNFLDLGPNRTASDAVSTRLVADVQGSAYGWDWNGAVGFTQVQLKADTYGAVNPGYLQQALDTNRYIPGGTNSAEALAFIAPVLSATDTSKLSFLNVNASRELAELQGGAMSLALGGSLVQRSLNAVAPADIQNGIIGGNNAFAVGSQNVKAVYAELLAPVLKTLELDAAVRYDRYNLSGGRASPKLGFKFQPMPEVGVRGTFSKGFRAPGPAENGNAGQSYLASATSDPVLCPDGNPSTKGNFPTQCGITPAAVNTTNAALKPETSTSFTLGLLLQPTKSLSARIDYYSIEISQQIITPALDYSVATPVRSTQLTPIPFVNPDGTTSLKAPPVGVISYYNNQYINANKTKTSGIDIDLEFRDKFADLGEWRSNLIVSQTLKYDLTSGGTTYHLVGTHGPSIISGDTGNPKTRIQWINTWTQGPMQWTGTLNYIGGYNITDTSAGMPDCLSALKFSGGAATNAFSNLLAKDVIPDPSFCNVKSFTTFDLNLRYTFSKNFSFTGTVLNLFNTAFPLDWATYGGSGGRPINPSLHTQGAIGRSFKVGATYNF